MNDFEAALAARASAAEKALEALLPPRAGDRLRDAMRYSVLGGGKRLRPFLVLESATLFAAPEDRAMRVASALECVHCYSLVHDDLPAMDDDDLRRGRATTHRAFDDATAILAGDALLTHAFAILAHPDTHPVGEVRAALVAALAVAAGDAGMCGGQMRDILAEREPLDRDGIATMQAMKTGALFRFACVAGAILGEAGKAETAALSDFGARLGAVFQVADDLLDENSDAADLGKATGKDRARGKATLPSLLGSEEARTIMETHLQAAQNALGPFGARAHMLRAAAVFAANRRS